MGFFDFFKRNKNKIDFTELNLLENVEIGSTQSCMFVFVGLLEKVNEQDLLLIVQNLNRMCTGSDLHAHASFSLNDKLISCEFEGTTYYVSLIDEEEELEEYVELAQNFELAVDLNTLTKENIAERYDQMKEAKSDFYKNEHFALGQVIFQELDKMNEIKIYSFL